MRTLVPALVLLAPAMLHAQPPLAPLKKLPSLSLLPPGSELNEVILPRYDENLRRVGVLKAVKMTLIDQQTISGETVTIEFSNPEGGTRGRVNLNRATFHQATGFLEARESVVLRSDRINANGTGLIYLLEQGEGFLTGPVTTWIQPPPPTAMKATPGRPFAAAITAMAILPQSLFATAPPPITDQEKAVLQADAAPAAPAHAAATLSLGADLIESLDASAAANQKVRNFIEESGASTVGDAAADTTPAAKELDIDPGPDDTVIRCDGGMYFDPDEGVFVFLKNVRVTDPRLTLTGANELKIFLAKKSPDSPATDKPTTGSGDEKAFAAKLGDVERVVATGAIHMVQKKTAEVDEPAEASGAIFSYNIKTGQATLSGGKLWGKRGQIALRAREPNLTLKVEKSGRLVTQGAWETIILTEK